MEEKIFAKGYCLAKIFIFFLIGCLIGTYYEEILWFVRFNEVVDRQGLIYGPFSPIYGVGVSIFVIFLGKHNDERSIWKTLIYASLIGGGTEFATSWIADVVFGVEFWNYTGYFLNIAGRTTIPFMIGWGIGGTFLMKVIYPFISKWIEKIPYHIAHPIYIVVVILLMIDIIITYSAFGRMALRNNGVEPYTFIGELMDEYYTNEFMYDRFPVMSPGN
ncbi:MAG: putative ABC transporter permease [Coprobacillus sp.]